MIRITIPQRAEGQCSVRGMKCEPLPVVRVGIVGLGARGLTLLRLMLLVPGARVTALCNISASAIDTACEALAIDPDGVARYSGDDGYLKLCRSDDVDLVVISTDWNAHTEIAVAAMQAGKHVAVEVPAALTMDDLWRLVDTSEQTRRHCTLLENCCYDEEVVAAIRDIRQGTIGEVVHAEGRYYHHLDGRWSQWRLDLNRSLRGDLYPTHELGPLCMALDINRSDRLFSLVSMDSNAFSGPVVYERETGTEAPDYRNGDHTMTFIRTALGKTILLQHDVITPQPYSRSLHIIGTKGDITTSSDNGTDPELICSSFRSVHDPMTYEMLRRLIACINQGQPIDIDVYDLASWCAVIPLSLLSIEAGNEPVAFPDFMRQ